MTGACDGGDGLPDEAAATLDSRVAELVRGRATIVVGTALAGATAVVEDLRPAAPVPSWSSR